MSLIRFDSTSARGPSAQLWHGVVDWVRGSLATALGQRDFEDFAPYTGPVGAGAEGRAGGTQISSKGEDPDVAHETDRYGVVSITEAAAADECVGLAREIWFDLQNSAVTVIEARIDVTSDDDVVQSCVGFTDQADPDDVFAGGVINSAGTEDFTGILWNNDETFDIVAVDAGTLTVLKNDIGVSDVARTDGFVNIGIRIEKVTSSIYRCVPSINGSIARAGIVNVASTVLPEGAMRPVVACTVDATTAPDIDIDFIYAADK